MISKDKSKIKINQLDSLLWDNISDLIAIVLPYDNCKIESINEYRYKQILGYIEDDLISDSFLNYVHLNDVKNVSKLLKKASINVKTIKEIRLQAKNGDYIWFNIKVKRFTDVNNFPRILCILKDLSEQKKIEEEHENTYKKLVSKIPEIKFWNLLTAKNTELALQNSYEMLQLVMENIPQYVIWKDFNFIYLGCNHNYSELVNLHYNESILGKKDEDLLWDKTHIKNLQIKEQKILSSNKAMLHSNESWITREGKQIWLDVNRVPLRDSKGNAIGILITYDDITEIQNTKVKLQESEEKYRLITENANDLIIIIDDEFKLEYINEETYLKLLGYSYEDIIGKTPFDFVHPDDVGRATESMKEGWDIGEKMGEFRLKHKEGHYLWFEIKGRTFFNDLGEKKGILISRDITERKKTEQKLQESEEDFRTITEESLIGICILQDQGIKYANQKMADLYGYTLEEMYSWKPQDIIKTVAPDFVEFFLDRAKKRLEGHQDLSPNFRAHARKRNGELFWVDISNIIIMHGGRPASLLTQIDITEQVRAEEELKKLNRLKTELLTRASHELKTPLISIKGFTELLLTNYSSKMDSEIINILEDIKEGSHRLENIIISLLNSAKLDRGKIDLNITTEDLSFLIKFCVRELQGVALLRNQRINLNIQENLITDFDKERIFEVLSNLLLNAIKYSPPGEDITIESTIKLINEEEFCIISVQDNGIGITEEENSLLFQQFGKIERFGQGYDIITEGSGLGLFISEKIIELHGGKIWVESKGRNKGSTFYFSFPTKFLKKMMG